MRRIWGLVGWIGFLLLDVKTPNWNWCSLRNRDAVLYSSDFTALFFGFVDVAVVAVATKKKKIFEDESANDDGVNRSSAPLVRCSTRMYAHAKAHAVRGWSVEVSRRSSFCCRENAFVVDLRRLRHIYAPTTTNERRLKCVYASNRRTNGPSIGVIVISVGRSVVAVDRVDLLTKIRASSSPFFNFSRPLNGQPVYFFLLRGEEARKQ